MSSLWKRYAPFIEYGLLPLALASFALEAAAFLLLLALPRLREAEIEKA